MLNALFIDHTDVATFDDCDEVVVCDDLDPTLLRLGFPPFTGDNAALAHAPMVRDTGFQPDMFRHAA